MNYPRLPMFLMQISQYAYALTFMYRKLFGVTRFFGYGGGRFQYFEHPYNRTWLNERALEIPIVRAEMQKHTPQDVLEIGNVTSHYFRFGHTVVDKYETRIGVLQQDVVDLELGRTFPLIISISTIEHVGWDETPRVPGKHRTALEVLRRHLSPGGKIVITFALGYNPDLDEDLYAGQLDFDQVYYFKRLTLENWQESTLEEVRGAAYNNPFRAGNGLIVGFCRK